MTTNFNRASRDPETNTRIGISVVDSPSCDDRLTHHHHHHQINDGIDSRWPPLIASSLHNEATMVPFSSTCTSSLLDLGIQRQQQLILEKETIKLARDQTRVLLPSGTGDNCRDMKFHVSSLTLANKNSRIEESTIPPCKCNESQDHANSPTSVMNLKKIKEPTETKMQAIFGGQNLNDADTWFTTPTGEQPQHQHFLPENQLQNQQQLQLQHYQLQNQEHHKQYNQYQQREVGFACLYPRDDQRSRVRFSQSLSVYDNFEDDDYNDGVHDNSPKITNQETAIMDEEDKDCKLFMLHRARRCWYSREELKTIKNGRKEIVRALRKVNFDLMFIDTSIHELRGLEAYLSPGIIVKTQRNRRQATESVLNEQHQQRQSAGGKQNVESLRLASLRSSEWFRIRAFEIAEKDAIEARALYLNHPEVMHMMDFLRANANNTTRTTECVHQQHGGAGRNLSMLYESFNESLVLMDIDDADAVDGNGNDLTLSFWANSSWTKDLMKE